MLDKVELHRSYHAQDARKPPSTSGLNANTFLIMLLQYSPRRPQGVFVSLDVPWKEAVAEQLNGMLLKWIDELPSHRTSVLLSAVQYT